MVMLMDTCQSSGRVSVFSALRVIIRQSSGLMLATMLLALLVTSGLAQDQGRNEAYAIFVSQRNGAAELFLIDLTSRQTSQLTNTGRGHYSPSLSADARTLVFASHQGAGSELYRADIGPAWRTRRPSLVGIERLTTNITDEFSPTLTLDGRTISFASGAGIELMSSLGTGRQLIIPTSPEYTDISPAVSPDGRQVAFVSNRGGSFDIWIYNRATADLRQVTNGAKALGGVSWSADSKKLAFTTQATNSEQCGIALVDVEAGSFRVLTESNDSGPSLSAKGDRVLFTSMRDGDPEIYLLDIAAGKVERLTNSAGLDESPIFLTAPARPVRVTP